MYLRDLVVVHLVPGVRRSLAAGLFLLRGMVAVAVAFHRPAAHLVESGAALLLFLGISTRAAATVVAGFELWLLAMRSGGWPAALVATMAGALALIGPGAWSLDEQWFGWRRINLRPTRNSRPGAESG
jgi:uncharacterized membrane protein YphA (DoxX/SURF4 family)